MTRAVRFDDPGGAFVFRTWRRSIRLLRRDLDGLELVSEMEPVEITSNPAILGGDGPMDHYRRYVAGPRTHYLRMHFHTDRARRALTVQMGRTMPFAVVVPGEARITGTGQIEEVGPRFAVVSCTQLVHHVSRHPERGRVLR